MVLVGFIPKGRVFPNSLLASLNEFEIPGGSFTVLSNKKVTLGLASIVALTVSISLASLYIMFPLLSSFNNNCSLSKKSELIGLKL